MQILTSTGPLRIFLSGMSCAALMTLVLFSADRTATDRGCDCRVGCIASTHNSRASP